MKRIFTTIALIAGALTISHAQTALNFDGGDDVVDIGTTLSDDLVGLSTFTLEAWVNPSSTAGLAVVVGNYNYPTISSEMQFLLRRDGDQYNFFISNGSTFYNVLSGVSTVTIGQWQHVVGTWDGFEMKIYIDGVELGSIINATGSLPTTINKVGVGNNAFGEPFEGTIDNIRIWNVTKTQAEILSTMNTCLTGFEAGLQALYTFEDGTGSSLLTDETGNGYDGTLTNMDPATDWIGSTGGPQVALDQTVTAATTTICPNSSTSIDLPISQDGVLYYLRDDSDNSILDGPEEGTSGVSFSTGNLSNTTTYNVYASYKEDITALNFDGIDDLVDFGNSLTTDLAGQNTITVEAWVNSATIATSGVIVGNYNYPVNNNNMQFLLRRDGGTYAFFINDGNGYSGLSSGASTAVAGVWQHVVGTWDGTTTRIYVDGVELNSNSSMTGPGFPSLPDNNVVLGDNLLNEQFSGDIDKVRIWTNARTLDQINETSGICLTGTEPGLIALYGMKNGPSSVTLTDETGNGYDGTLTNMDPITDWVQGVECSTCGSQMTTTVTVTVEDVTAPALAGIPSDINITTNAANCEATVTWTEPTTTDNCTASPSLISTHNSGDNFPVGTTTVSYTATDDEGNDVTESFDVIVTSDLDANATTTDETLGADGSIDLTVSGGTAPFSYDWTGPNGYTSTDQNPQDLVGGTYEVTITDDNGCTFTLEVIVDSTVGLKENTSINFNVYPNPSNGLFTIDSPIGGTMEVINNNGQILRATTIPNGKTEHQLTQLAHGVYSVRLTTEYGVQLKKLVIQ